MVNSAEQIRSLEAALVALRRMQRRRTLAGHAVLSGQRRGRHAKLPDSVVELIDLVDEETAAQRPVSVTRAAELLGVDQPRASRLVADALAAGLLLRQADQVDGRRSLLRLTAAGRRLLGQVHEFRCSTIAAVIVDWSDRDRAALMRLLPRFVRDWAAVTGPR